MQSENYKKRASDVRRTARAHLLEIRQARMARRSADRVDVANLVPADASIDEAFTLPDQWEDHIDEIASVGDQQDAEPVDTLDALAEKNAAMGDEMCAPAVTSETPDDDVSPLAEEAAEDAFHTPDGTAGAEGAELAQLPGAGPGLIWMLGQCDVHTLADLAACDRDDLTERLGVVGDIFDVGQWIEFAQCHQEPNNNSSL